MNIAIRADASIAIGGGHIMRCLCLARALVQHWSPQEITVTFICHALPESFKRKIETSGFNLAEIAINTTPGASWPQAEDAGHCLEIVNAVSDLDLLIVDHYQLDQQWQTLLKPHCNRLLVIDDLANRVQVADFLLDQTIGRSEADYRSLVPQSCQLLIGADYILLRDEFLPVISQAKHKRSKTRRIKTIIVSLGAMDANNVSETVINGLIALHQHTPEGFTVDVVMGANAPHLAVIKRLIAPFHWLSLHIDTEQMASLMLAADLAIGASGSTAWERCSLGLPTLSIELADNQRLVSQNLSQQGAIINLGSAERVTSAHIAEQCAALMNSPTQYQAMVQHCFSCCDGLGAMRVTARVMPPKVTLQKACLADREIIFHWQSNPEIRQFSRNKNAIGYEEHCQWFQQTLAMSSRHLFLIIELQGNMTTPVGMIRFDDLSANEVEISILVAPEAQGRKIALQAIRATPAIFRQKTIHAHVHADNAASQRLFTQAKFTKIAEDQFILSPQDH